MKKIALVLPGGGVRGVQQQCILSAIDRELSKLIQDYKGLGNYIDYFSGTSIGALGVVNSSLLDENGMTQKSFDDGVNFFIENAENVLVRKPWFYGITKSFYSNEAIKNILSKIVADKTVGDNILKGKFLITSYCLNNCEPTIWTNIGTEEQRKSLNYCVKNIDQVKLKDIVTASVSLPALLPAHEIEYWRDDENNVLHEIDGGFVSNTPILDLISCIARLEKINLSDVFVLSVGTGKINNDLSSLKNGGILSYSQNLSKIMSSHINSVQMHDEEVAKRFVEGCGGKIHTIDVPMTTSDFINAIDDSKQSINYYKSMADNFIQQNTELIQSIAHELADWINSNS
jgi:patatin-like phospholipase/acyl hydrolase